MLGKMVLERTRLAHPLKHFFGNTPGDRIPFARLLADQGNFEKARKEIGKVLSKNKNNVEAHRVLAEISRRNQDIDLFEKTLHRILMLDPEDKQAKEDLCQIQALKGVQVDETKEIVTQTLADIYAEQGYYLKAYELYEALSRKEPENRFYHQRLANLKEKIMKGLSRRLKRKDA